MWVKCQKRENLIYVRKKEEFVGGSRRVKSAPSSRATHPDERFCERIVSENNAGIDLYCPLETQGKVVEDRRAIALGCCEGLTATHIEIKAV
jgi:hypothetical protein